MYKISGTTQILAVIGHPISHSLSPLMHNALLQQLGLDAVYIPWDCPVENLPHLISTLRTANFLGANLTLPHKEVAVGLVDELTPIAQFMGSVNTIYWHEGKLWGTTTDPYGALTNLREHGVQWTGKKIAILGNGGAARALAFALLATENSTEIAAELCLVGRNSAKVQALADSLSAADLGRSPRLTQGELQNFGAISAEYDIIINTTAVGMAPNRNDSPLKITDLHPHQVVYDIVYNPLHTQLLRDAQARGAQIVTGIGMLVHQGALSFKHWFPHVEPDIKTMFSQLPQF